VAKYGEEGRLFDLSVRGCGCVRIVLINRLFQYRLGIARKITRCLFYGYAGFGEYRR